MRQPQVNPDATRRWRFLRHNVITQQADKVSPCRVFADGHGSDLRSLRNLTGPTNRERLAHLRQFERSAIPAKGTGGVFGRLRTVFAFESSVSRAFREEINKRRLQ